MHDFCDSYIQRIYSSVNAYYKHIVKQIMMKTENKTFRQNVFKKSIQQQLFKHSNPTKTQNQFLQLYLQLKKNPNISKVKDVLLHSNPKSARANQPNTDLQQQINTIQNQLINKHHINPNSIRHKSTKELKQGKIRSLTCGKFKEDYLSNDLTKDKNIKNDVNDLATMLNKKDSGSKKSTDASLNDQKEQLQLENKQFKEHLKAEENKIKKMTKAINDQRKRQEIQIFLLEKSIQKLRKKTTLVEDNQQNEEEILALSIQIYSKLVNNQQLQTND